MATEPESAVDQTIDHPVDPLTRSEIEAARDILESERDIDSATRYVKIVLDEPSKDALRDYEKNGTVPSRKAFVILRDPIEKATYEAYISLTDGELTSWEHIEGVQPSITLEEFDRCEETVKANEEWRQAVAKRGVENFDLAIVDPWSAGHHLVPDDIDTDRRLSHAMSFIRTSEDDNGYARPLDGVHAWVDLDDMEVVKVLDTGVSESNVIDELEDAQYREEHRDLRTDLKPYNVDQPEGPSWDIDGRKVEWQNWHLRVGWTQREGLVLHNVGYEDDGEIRSVLNRASCAEMSVPYGSRDPNENWKNAFDVGEYNIGSLANPLTEGCDCLGYMHYFDGVMCDSSGDVNVIPNAICLHEEDYGTLWKHTDWRTENTEVRRNRRLVISFVATVGNYDYQFNWYLYQDGSIEGQVRLTGIDSVGLMAPDEDPGGFAEELAPQVKGMIHQHFFNFRLDVDIDGAENELYRVQNQAVPAGPNGVQNDWPGDPEQMNPAGQAFYAEKTQLESEQEAQELTDPHKGRYWQVVNPNKTNCVDEPAGYKLAPGENVEACAQPGSSVQARASFIDNHIWATPHRDDERFPAGEYPNQNPGSEGLPEWTEADRSLDGEDIVLWYTLGVNHITRPEDWPILPVHIASFKLEPVNFFDENPSIDVPPEHAIKDVQQRRAEKYDDPDAVSQTDD
ncbi:primary-amine oxidase [Halarchaeum nitratireducens]|uniref:Amine oxidase n=1 Tax=Halarchaeum nitratireducens TaxID=489913 RepID=A0A830GEK2_9EURY|nr:MULTISPECIES: primary-amine oxidase [Halarchaeum]MBP2251073.1 primary-amine oxidase [Halarchaeum solikamskense]GGN22050.1 amine oxidase [Halarchaeum nitratireducens]